MSANDNKKKTVFILYIPGGAMHGIIPAITLGRIESLTETPTSELFQVMEGVSTGSILVAGLNVPGMTARKGIKLFSTAGPRFFPEMPGRWAKMHVRNGINLTKVFTGLDPLQADFLKVKEIQKLCDQLSAETSIDKLTAYNLREAATERWLTKGSQKKALALCERIKRDIPGSEMCVDAIAELLSVRTYTGRLGVIFKKHAVGILDRIKDKYAPPKDYLFDPKIPEDYYKNFLGDMQVSDCPKSVFISAYDIINNRVVTFSTLKQDMFNDTDNDAGRVSHDIKLWDAVMASTANPLAFPPHITETGLLCSDKAPIHKPRSVNEVLSQVDDDTKVVLVIAGTGKYFSKDLSKFLERDLIDGAFNDEEKQRKKLELLRDYYVEFGVAGNLAMGRELSELTGYTFSDAMDDFKAKIGEENIIDLNPRMAPHSTEEETNFPSRDLLDASRENIKKLIQRGRSYLREDDEKIRNLAQMLADNLHRLGKMDDEKYKRVTAKIGLKGSDTGDFDLAKLEKEIPCNSRPSLLKRLYNYCINPANDTAAALADQPQKEASSKNTTGTRRRL